MKIDARLDSYGRPGPDPWDDSWGTNLPLGHIICREVDGTPHFVAESVWPWTAYTKDQSKFELHFYYWNQKLGPASHLSREVTPEREARMRELQFLMTRLIYFGPESAPRTLEKKISSLHCLARFAEARSSSIRQVLTECSLLDACGASIPEHHVQAWISWINFLRRLNPATQLGFSVASPKKWKSVKQRAKDRRDKQRQKAPLPTRIYGALINNLSAELDDIEAHSGQLLAALEDALVMHPEAKATCKASGLNIGPALIEKHSLVGYLTRRGFNVRHRALSALSGAVGEIFLICRLNIHVFSGMRTDEARMLPYHCMLTTKGLHGQKHRLIAGITTKFNKGRRLRTKWVTTDKEGFRAVRLAQRFASVIYASAGVTPSNADSRKDQFPLFPSTDYLPWGKAEKPLGLRMQTTDTYLHNCKEELHARLIPFIEEQDIVELEVIDAVRAWRSEEEFAIGKRWPLTVHQLRRSLALYANASGLVSLPSLRRQLQHITREMSLYYGRGSTFCKNFVANDPQGYKRHLAPEWQDGENEALALAFTREVLSSREPMFGGAGNFYQRQMERGEIMSLEEVAKRMKAGFLSYQPGPLGGCTKSGGCDKRKGLALIDISCATAGCKNLIGKHSKIIRVIQLKRAALAHMTQDSIEGRMEIEELEALERVECKWRPQTIEPVGSAAADRRH